MKKQTVDITTSIILLVLCLTGFLLAGNISVPQDTTGYGPTFFPRLVLILLALLSSILLIKGIRSYKHDEEKIHFDKDSMLKTAVFIILLLIYLVLFFVIGFIFSSIIFLFIAQLIFGIRNITKLVVVSVFVPIILYFIFTNLFQIPLP